MSALVPVPVENPQNYSDAWNCPKCRCQEVPQQLYVPADSQSTPPTPEQLMVQCGRCNHSYYMKCADAPQS